jgi:hypothetical protein
LVGDDNEPDIKRYGRMVSLYGVASIANSIRVEVLIPTDNNSMPMNMFAVGFAKSGISKTRSLGYMKSWIQDSWDTIKSKGNNAMEMKDPFALEEVTDLTKDGVTIAESYKSMTDSSMTALMRVLDIVGYGSINLIVDEFASVISRDYDLLSSSVLEIYDRGQVSVNLRKTSKTKRAETCIPMNLLAFGSPHLLFETDANTEKLFTDLLQAGLARRSIFVNVDTSINKYNLETSIAVEASISDVKQKFVQIVEKYDHKVLSLSSSAKQAYMALHDANIQESSEISEFRSIQKIYARNKHWLALKLCGVVAISNFHDEVELEDFMYAQQVVEDSYLDLISIISRPEKYEVVVNYLLDKGTTESEYTLTKELPFYKEIKSKKQFLELAKGYAYNNNITLQIHDRQNVTFYSARGKVKTDLNKPIMFSYATEMSDGYYTNDEFLWEDLYKVVTKDGVFYSAHSFKDGHRSNENAITGFQLVILDIDGGCELETAKALFSDYTYLIATTRSHQKDKNGKIEDRFRIILPMEYALDLEAETYSKMMKNLFDDLPINVDRLHDAGRMFFGASGEYWYNTGEMLNCDKYIDYTQEKEIYDKEGAKLSKKNINGISQYIIRNQHNGRNNVLAKLSLLLMDSGYTHEEAKAEVVRVNNQFDNPLPLSELEKTVFKTIQRREEVEIEEDDDESYYETDDRFSSVNY